FFQAEDGIRDGHVTGVQTCALPIFRGVYTEWNECAQDDSEGEKRNKNMARKNNTTGEQNTIPDPFDGQPRNYQYRNDNSEVEERSEERRVGKECRSRRAQCH